MVKTPRSCSSSLTCRTLPPSSRGWGALAAAVTGSPGWHDLLRRLGFLLQRSVLLGMTGDCTSGGYKDQQHSWIELTLWNFFSKVYPTFTFFRENRCVSWGLRCILSNAERLIHLSKTETKQTAWLAVGGWDKITDYWELTFKIWKWINKQKQMCRALNFIIPHFYFHVWIFAWLG